MTLAPYAPVGRRAAAFWWMLAAGAILLVGFGVRAAYYRGPYFISDEDITVQVVGHMRHSGDWDTNWAKADLSPDLKYDQYNFSSHLYATYFFYRLVKLVPGLEAWRSADEGLGVYRFFSVLLAALVVWQTLRLAQLAGGRAVALGAGVLTAVATQLVQDAHYIRPDAFTTALALAAVALSWPRAKLRAGLVVGAAFVIGLLLACKVSMLLLAWLPLVPVAVAWRERKARWIAFALFPLALAAGFATGAPGAVAHPGQFFSGVQHLMTQYGGLHPPHSHLHGGPVADILASFFSATLGWPLLACAAFGTGVLAWQRRWAELALLAGPVALFAGYFATKSVFFERNLSHVLPLLFILAALGVAWIAEMIAARTRVPGPIVAAAIIALLAVQPAILTARLVGLEFSGRGAERSSKIEVALRQRYPEAAWLQSTLLNTSELDPVAAHFQSSRAPLLLRVTDYHDEWTAACLEELSRRFEAQLVADSDGSFPGVPTSTLVVYHSWHDRYYLVTKMRTK